MASWRPDRYGGLRSLLRSPRIPEEVREELEHHVAERTAANVARGMSARAAREDALRRFGSMARFSRETELVDEGIEREARRMEVMSTLWRELRQAWRGLARAPGFSFIAVVTLSLGMGATAAVYTLLDRVVISPLPYPDAERLVTIDHPAPGVKEGDVWNMSSASYVQFSEQARSLEDIAVYARNTSNVRMGESATQADIVVASANLFGMLGARAAIGRVLQPSDDTAPPLSAAFPGAPAVVVISYEYWQNELGGDPGVVGRVLHWEGLPLEIVGVTQAGFAIADQGTDIYFPARIKPAGPHYNAHNLSSIALLRAGATIETAQRELAQLTARLPEVYPNAPAYRRVNWAFLREGTRGTASRGQLRVRGALVVTQIALALVLLAAAGLMLRSFAGLRNTDTGLDADQVLAVSVLLPRNPYGSRSGGATEYWRQLSERIATLPGVTHVGATTRIPLISDRTRCALLTVRPPATQDAALNCIPSDVVSPSYFSALGISVSGRTPTWDDIRNGSGAVAISRSLANTIWPGVDAIGRELRVPNSGDAWYRIVGIAEDVRHEGVDRPATGMVYYPVEGIEGAQLWGANAALTLLVRTTSSEPVQLTASIRRFARELEPAAAIADVQTMPQVIARSMARTSFTMVLLLIAGAMALVLSVVGLYGVIAYAVDRRRHEIGIRMALGARASAVSGMILLDLRG